MKKFIYTIILAVGFQFAQAQTVETIFLVQQFGSERLYLDMKDLKLNEKYPVSGQHYVFYVDVRFTNTSGVELYPKDSINEEDGEIAHHTDSIRLEIRMNNNVRYPLQPDGYTVDPNKGYISPVSQELKVLNGDSLLYADISDKLIAVGEKGFLGIIPFQYPKAGLRTGKDNPNTLCVSLTHLKNGPNAPTSLSNELCINFYMITKDTIPPGNVIENTLNTVKILPNPTKDRIKIENLNETTNISIYSITGQLLTNIPSAMGNVEVNVSDLANGVYFIKMQNRQSTRTAKIQIVK